MLHEVTGDGGMGFCHEALPSLTPWGYHGPLVVALDWNVIIDLQQHGSALLDDELPHVDAEYAAQLAGLADLLNLWLLRDIRFVVTPRALTDAKKLTKRVFQTRGPTVAAIAETLAFQLGDWTYPAPSAGTAPRSIGEETGLPDSADRDLVLEAQAIGAHAFLTRDRKVLRNTRLSGPPIAVISPQVLARELAAAEVGLFAGGTCSKASCPYAGWPTPAPDLGKWGPFLALFESEP